MLGKLFSAFGRAGEVRTLTKDAQSIIADAEGRFEDKRLGVMGTEIARHIGEGREWLSRPNMGHDNVLLHFKGQHREARRSQRDLDLSAYTLVIIYFRAEQIGEEAVAAKRTVEEFVEKWEEDPAETTRNSSLEA
ncbi:MAG: hypothetical protein K0U93_06215 [Gammaproteobacteria bacterium]|nr:hypothetical protein [Gammaproteobacteria bacterium]